MAGIRTATNNAKLAMAEERHGRRSPIATPSEGSAATTTIGKYIARFRFEQPLPREARSGFRKEDFWWKNSSSSKALSASRRSRSARSLQSASSFDDSDLGNSLASSSSHAGSSRSSMISGYDPHHQQQKQDTRDDKASGDDDDVAVERSPAPSASGAELLLSSGSWSSLPYLEPPSSSADAEQDANQGRSELHPHVDHSDDGDSSGVVVSDPQMAMEEEKEDAQPLEDAELVIERVRKRLGFRSIEDLSAFRSSPRYEESGSSSSPSPPQWQQHDADYLPYIGPSREVEATSSAYRRRHLPDTIESLELALSELSSKESPAPEAVSGRLGDRVNEPLELSTPTAAAFSRDAVSRYGGVGQRKSERQDDGVESSQSSGVASRTSFESDVEFSGQESRTADLDNEALDTKGNNKEELSLPMSSTLNRGGDYLEAPGTENDIVVGESVAEENAQELQQDMSEPAERPEKAIPFPIAGFPLLSAESPVIPASRRAASSSSTSFPPHISASSSPSDRRTPQSSHSSVTAETAKTLDGLVSLVVQSWSSDFFQLGDAAGGGTPSADQFAQESSTDGQRSNASDHAIEAQAEESLTMDGGKSEESIHEKSDTSPLSESNRRVSEWKMDPIDSESPGSESIASGQKGVTTVTESDSVDKTKESYEKDEAELSDDESDEDQDDEIVRVLRSRISLYEEALRRLEGQ